MNTTTYIFLDKSEKKKSTIFGQNKEPYLELCINFTTVKYRETFYDCHMALILAAVKMNRV